MLPSVRLDPALHVSPVGVPSVTPGRWWRIQSGLTGGARPVLAAQERSRRGGNSGCVEAHFLVLATMVDATAAMNEVIASAQGTPAASTGWTHGCFPRRVLLALDGLP